MSHGITIGMLAKRTRCQAETIRYYEREGLLPAPARSQGNYRQYDSTHVERLSFIRHCRSLDMTLDEIRALLDFRDAPTRDCADVSVLLDEHADCARSPVRPSAAAFSMRCRAPPEVLTQPVHQDTYPAPTAATELSVAEARENKLYNTMCYKTFLLSLLPRDGAASPATLVT